MVKIDLNRNIIFLIEYFLSVKDNQFNNNELWFSKFNNYTAIRRKNV